MLRCLLSTTLVFSPVVLADSVFATELSMPKKPPVTNQADSPAGLLASVIHPAPPVKLDTVAKNEPEHITILMVGDTGYAPSRTEPLPTGVYKYGRWQTFEQTTRLIRQDINADVNFANIETVISASKKLRPFPKKYNFVTHPNGAKHLVDAGFNLFSLANNHSFDYGQRGIRDTLQNSERLKKHGLLAHAGIGLNQKQAAKVPVFQIKSTSIAFGAIGIGAGGGGIQRATQTRPGQLNLNNSADVALLASNLKNASANLRLLSIHRGKERNIRPYSHEVGAARSLVRASDADILIGHHAHVTRGMEITDGRLIIYGLGNFLHQGTANMNTKGGCQDYSLIVKAHFTRFPDKKPQLAAIEATPINSTHMQTRKMSPTKAAKRIAILNGLANQFDNPANNSRGVRFMAQSDGTGLYCTNAAQIHPATRNLCANYAPRHLASNNSYARATTSCGRYAPTLLIAKPNVNNSPKSVLSAANNSKSKTIRVANNTATNKLPQIRTKKFVTKARILQQNPKNWPAGMPLAWQVPPNETKTQKLDRWAKKRYSIAEVESLLKKRGLL